MAPPPVTPALAATPSSTLQQAFTPSLQLAPVPAQQQQISEQQPLVGAGASLSEVAAFIRGERDESRREREEWQDRLEKQALETERARQEVDRLRDAAVEARVREAQTHEHQIVALQSRLETMHAAKLLNDSELDSIEDAIADS
jgi:hypothetical protein